MDSTTEEARLSSLKLIGRDAYWEGVELAEVLTPEEWAHWYAGLAPAIERARRVTDG